jgi:hypothetical protein
MPNKESSRYNRKHFRLSLGIAFEIFQVSNLQRKAKNALSEYEVIGSF